MSSGCTLFAPRPATTTPAPITHPHKMRRLSLSRPCVIQLGIHERIRILLSSQSYRLPISRCPSTSAPLCFIIFLLILLACLHVHRLRPTASKVANSDDTCGADPLSGTRAYTFSVFLWHPLRALPREDESWVYARCDVARKRKWGGKSFCRRPCTRANTTERTFGFRFDHAWQRLMCMASWRDLN